MEAEAEMKLFFLLLLTQFHFLSGYPSSWRTSDNPYMPGPQFCPDTGRTVCPTVQNYPTQQIYSLLISSRSQVFNLTSVFVDERKGDVEPNLSQLPTPKPHYEDSYSGNQHPPMGRFSPAGYGPWNTPSSDKPSVFSRLQPDRWRQVSDRHGQGQYTPGTDHQSKTQGLPNQRVSFSMGNNAPFNFRFNFEDHQNPVGHSDVTGNGEAYDNAGVTRNRIDPQYQQQNSYLDDPQHFSHNFTGYFTRDAQQQQDPYQIQPPQTPQTRYGVKGRSPYQPVTMRPQVASNWKGSPAFNDRSVTLTNYQGSTHNSRYNYGRRERRNEDVEVACRARSTYVPPRAALNDNSEWKYIVNVPERDSKFTQVIRVDICQNAGEPCSSRLSFPFGYESRCRQKYIKKKLLSLNPDGQGTSEDNFFIPSCCVCEIVRQDSK